MTRTTFLLTALLGTISVGAVANDMSNDSDSAKDGLHVKVFTELDANSDGVLDQTEVQVENFAQIDSDGDGEVNRNEYYQYHLEQENPESY